MNINHERLVPGAITYWGDVVGDIADQKDLVDYVASHGGGGGGDVTKAYVDEENARQDEVISGIDTRLSSVESALPEGSIATESWVENKGYLVQDDLSQYATRQWVTGRGYLVEGDIKTVNDQSLVGEGNIEIEGITQEQEDAIEPLMNPETGLLSNVTLTPMKNVAIPSKYAFANGYFGQYLSIIDGDVYCNYFGSLYKFNFDIIDFELIGGFPNGGILWKDNSGRYYSGVSWQYDLENGTFSSVNLNAADVYVQTNNHNNIWHGPNGIYLLCNDNTAMKFDETNQTFVNWQFDYSQDWTETYLGAGEVPTNGIWYGEHFVFLIPGFERMYELIEHEDRLELVLLSEPYFPMYEGGSYDSFESDGSDVYYIASTDNKKLVNGVWEDILSGQEMRIGRYGVLSGDFLIGMGNYDNNSSVEIANIGSSSVSKTSWKPIEDITAGLVDLSSSQTISGTKTFTGSITVNSILNFNYLNATGNPFLNLNNEGLIRATNQIKVESKKFTFNGKDVAVTDQCILNKVIYPYGPEESSLVSCPWDPYVGEYFKTHSGRLLHLGVGGDLYEFTGSGWIDVNDNCDYVPGNNVIVTENHTFAIYDDSTWLWDDANNTFENICGIPGGKGYVSDYWPLGDDLMYANEYRLVEDGGSWDWESDSTLVGKYPYSKSFLLNGETFCDTGGDIQAFNENSGEFESRATLTQHTSAYTFVCGGDILFYTSNGWKKVDFSSSEYYKEAAIEIPSFNASNYHTELNGQMWYMKALGDMRYCYKTEMRLPEVPGEGEYFLKATNDDIVTQYSWEDGTGFMNLVDMGLDYDVVDRPSNNPDIYNSEGYILSLLENYDTIEEDGDNIERKIVNYLLCEDQNLFQRQFIYHDVDGEWELQNEFEYEPAWVGGAWNVGMIHILGDDPDYQGKLDDFPVNEYFDIGWDKLPFGKFQIETGPDGEALFFNGFCWDMENEKLGLYKVTPIDVPGVGYDGYDESFIPFVAAEEPDTSTDATYVLKATVQDGEVTYEWVPDNNR